MQEVAMALGRILVVDDELDVRKSIGFILAKAGFDVIEAEDGEKAITAIRSDDNPLMVDTIICDLSIPKVNGIETILYFRAQFPSVPVIVLTGKPYLQTAVAMFKQGVVDYLIKPVEPEKLTASVRQAVELHKHFNDKFVVRAEIEEKAMLNEQTATQNALSSLERRRQCRRLEDAKLLQRQRELEAARCISLALFQRINVNELMEQVLRTALEVIGAEAGSILLADPVRRQLIFLYVIGSKAEVLHGAAIPWDKGLAGAVFHSGKPVVCSDIGQDPRHFSLLDLLTDYKTTDMIVLPLKRWDGNPIGVLEVLNKRQGRLDQDDMAILTVISALSAETIEQARLFEEAKLAEIVRLLGDIGHDAKNLLTPLVVATQMLQLELNELFSELPPSGASKAQASHERCNEVIAVLRGTTTRLQNRMKEIADCVQGVTVPPEFTRCRIAHVVNYVFKTLGTLAGEKGITLRTEGLETLPAILADENRLFNAFYNLVNNAIPEVPAGGSITIRGHAEPDAGVVVIEVADTGRGMPPHVRAHLFTARVISRKPGGTGLGTKIIKDVVDVHGGQITVDSEEGQGTTFRILLPLCPPGCAVPTGESISGKA